MCHESLMEFGRRHIDASIVGKHVLEAGSYNVNGSLRDVAMKFNPASYTGVDIMSGPGVDIVMSAAHLEGKFGKEYFNFVISTSMLEHTIDWKACVYAMKACLKVGGRMLVCVPAPGFMYHNPPDHWRFSMKDFQKIFADMETIELIPDPQAPGTMFFGRKITSTRLDLSDFEVANTDSENRHDAHRYGL